MKVDHITHFSNHTSIRDTNDINLKTIDYFKDFQIQQGQKTLPVEKTNFKVKVTVTGNGQAAFDIIQNNETKIVNFCCLEPNQKEKTEKLINETCKSINRASKTDVFIYSIPVASMDAESSIIAGEIEFYIFYALFLAYKKQ